VCARAGMGDRGGVDPDAIESHVDLFHAAGDHVTLLRVYDKWVASGSSEVRGWGFTALSSVVVLWFLCGLVIVCVRV
jgi:hypothetical protein